MRLRMVADIYSPNMRKLRKKPKFKKAKTPKRTTLVSGVSNKMSQKLREFMV